MQEAVAGAEGRVEFEIRGGAWEGIHAVVFYIALTMAVLATACVLRVYFGIACIVLLFYSMLAIFSSPRFIVIDKGGISLLKYHFFLPRRVALPRDALEGVEDELELPAVEDTAPGERCGVVALGGEAFA